MYLPGILSKTNIHIVSVIKFPTNPVTSTLQCAFSSDFKSLRIEYDCSVGKPILDVVLPVNLFKADSRTGLRFQSIINKSLGEVVKAQRINSSTA